MKQSDTTISSTWMVEPSVLLQHVKADSKRRKLGRGPDADAWLVSTGSRHFRVILTY